MKKILLVMFLSLFLGCTIKDDTVTKEKKELKIKTSEKKLYKQAIRYVDHDDAINIVSKVNYEKNSNDSNLNDDDNYQDLLKEVTSYNQEESEQVKVNNIIDETNKTDENMVKDKEIKEESKENNNLNDVKIESDTKDEKITEQKQEVKEETKTSNNGVNTSNNISDNSSYVKKGYYSPSSKYLGEKNVKVIDVSYYQGNINWDLFANSADCYGVILRLGYYQTLDKKFERNITALKRLNIPYGIYLFSYSSTVTGANKEANFTNKMIDKYNLNPILGIYYDIESWSTKNSTSNNITKSMYDNIITTYISKVSYHVNYKYKVKVYSGRWYAMNRLGYISRKYVDWVAEYNSVCKYNLPYSMWQYTSKGKIPGINTNVDISYIL